MYFLKDWEGGVEQRQRKQKKCRILLNASIHWIKVVSTRTNFENLKSVQWFFPSDTGLSQQKQKIDQDFKAY